MRRFQTNAISFERRIAKELGVTDAGLETLLRHEKTRRTGNNCRACRRMEC
jgi:hypothetical protein